jgi:hypothetical protein
MHHLPASSASTDATALVDDFEWPPRGDDESLSIHEIETDPWHPIAATDDGETAPAVPDQDDATRAATPARPRPHPSR